MSGGVTYYDLVSGRIVGRLVSDDQALIALNQADGTGKVPGLYDERTHYFDVMTLTMIPRPVMDLQADKATIKADGIDLVTIEGLPFGPVGHGVRQVPGAVGAKVSVYGPVEDQWQQALGGNVQLTADMPGEYHVIVECWPFIPGRVVFDAT